jgi:peptide/nickel transport system substrate-binding protein
MPSVNKLEHVCGKPRAVCRVALVFSLLLIFCACAQPLPVTDDSRQTVTLTIGLPLQAGPDPLRGATQAARLISREGLTLPNRTGRVQPRLAESWTESTDGLTWRFKLRPTALFHDNRPVNSEAVKISLERSIATEIDQYPGLSDIVSVEAATPVEVVIHLSARSTFLLDDLGVSILKVRAGKPTIGAGPYVPLTTSENELTLQAFPGYYRGKPEIDRVVLRAYPTARTAWASMMRGEVDFLYEVGPEAREFIKNESSVSVFPFIRPYLLGLLLNSRAPALSDWRVRRAMNYAINRAEIVAMALHGHGTEATSAAWPQHWAYDASAQQLAYDPSRAVALLDETKLPSRRPSAGIPARLAFSCLIPENFTLWERLALHVQRDLADVGVDLQLEKVTVNEFNRRIETGAFDAALTEFVAGNSPTRPFTFWYSQAKGNFWGYTNPMMDDALDGIRRAVSETAYREAFRQFQSVSVNDPPAIFLAFGETARAVSKRFEVVAPPGSDILPTIADWRLAAFVDRTSN